MPMFIPKKEEANRVSDFRPFSLVNVTYKIITEVLTKRLNPKLDLLMDKVHSRFIKGGYILDGVAAQEIVSQCFRNQVKGGMLLKLDFANAYDMLDWRFVLEVLHARGFGVK